jgi:hypothetical protein
MTINARAVGSVAMAVSSPVIAMLLLCSTCHAADSNAASTGDSFFSPVEDYFAHWFDRVSKTQAEQPHWITPLATVTPRLEEELRYDQQWQARPHDQMLYSFGAGKGLELIPTEKTEIILGVPAWQEHTNHHLDGWADENVLLKYRLLSANEENGNYIVSLFTGISIPTGDVNNTADHFIITPALSFGKGWGDFDVISTVGVGVPDAGEEKLGIPTTVNTAFQYRVLKYFWPEFEVNYTHWSGGEHAGLDQVLITPGLVIGRFPIWERLGLTIGAGYQVAITRDALLHNNIILSVRLPF